MIREERSGPRDFHRTTGLLRALSELGITLIPAYSPQARGRSERNFRTWQGRLPQELRIRGIKRVAKANRFLRETYIAEFNAKFAQPAKQPGTAFVACRRELDFVFALQHERTVARDNTVSYDNRILQIEKMKWRNTLSGCKIKVYEHLDGTISLRYGPNLIGHYSATGVLLDESAPTKQAAKRKTVKSHQIGKQSDRDGGRPAVEMPRMRKAPKNVASLSRLEKSVQKTKADRNP